MVSILGTKKQFLLVAFQIILYSFCCFVVFKNDLMRLDTIVAADYYNPNDFDTKIYFVSQEIKSMVDNNF